MLLTDSVRKIKGVGEKAEQCLNKMNIYSIADESAGEFKDSLCRAAGQGWCDTSDMV